MKSELWPVLTGLEVASQFNLEYITVVCMLNNLQVEDESESRLLSLIRRTLCNFSSYSFAHVFREGNTFTDTIANFSFVQEESYSVFESPTHVIFGFLFYF